MPEGPSPQPQPSPPERPDASLRDARLLRLLADDELDAVRKSRLEAALSAGGPQAEAARARLEFERRLRQAIWQAMKSSAAPADLRAAIAAAMAKTSAGVGEDQIAAEATPSRFANAANGVTGVVGITGNGDAAVQPSPHLTLAAGDHPAMPHRDRMRRFFAAPQRANILAIAAVLALIAGAVLFGIFGRTIDDVRQTPNTAPVDVIGNAAAYADREHSECTTDTHHIQQQTQYLTATDAEVGLTEHLGMTVHVFDLSALGYDFIGAGKSAVPVDKQPSGRLMYRKTVSGKPGPMVSVFIAPARGPCRGMCSRMRPGQWDRAEPRPSIKRRVLYSTDKRLVYFLVCCDDRDLDKVSEIISQEQPQVPSSR